MVENKLEDLKKKINQYENLTDSEKINNIQLYNELASELDKCKIILAASKNTFKNIGQSDEFDIDDISTNSIKKKQKKIKTKEELNMEKLMENIKEMRSQLENKDLTLQELIHLYDQFNHTQIKLKSMLKDKKMEIIKVE